MSQFDYRAFRRDWESLLASENYIECEALCQESLQQNPSNKHRSKLYNHLGFIYENYLDDKTFDDILEHYVLALQVDEDNASAHYNLSNFLLEQGMQHLLRALELKPKHVKAKQKLALLQPVKHGDLIKIRPLSQDGTSETDHADYTRAYICDDVTGEGIECSEVLYKQSEGKYVKRASDLRSKSARRDVREQAQPGMIATLLGQGLEKSIQDFLVDLNNEIPMGSEMSGMDVDSSSARSGHKRKKSSKGGGSGMIGTQHSFDAGEREGSNNGHARSKSVLDEDGPVVSVRRGGKTTNKNNYGDSEGNQPQRNHRKDDSGVIGGASLLSDMDIASGCCDCCQWCVPLMYYWCIWLTLVILSFGGLAVYGYGWWAQDCEDEIESDQNALFSTGGGSTLSLDILILADCTDGSGNDTWNDQISAIETFLTTIDGEENAEMVVAYGQSCGNVNGTSNVQITQPFEDYSTFTAETTLGDPLTNMTSPNGGDYYLADVMDECYMAHNRRETDNPFLCIPVMSTQPADLIDTVETANEFETRSLDTLLVFIPLSNTDAIATNMLHFLGTVGLTTDQCSTEQVNSWWSATFDEECSLSGDQETSDACAHCIPWNYDMECQVKNMVGHLEESDLYTETFNVKKNKNCEVDRIYEYGLAGVVPLLIYSIIALVNACCVTCCVSSDDTVRAHSNHLNL